MSAAKNWLPLELNKDRRHGVAFWKSCPPFVENSRGVLIHRPREVTVYDNGPRWGKHIAVHYHCGGGSNGGKNFTFLSDPPVGKLLCAVCEARAVMAELPSADSLCGRHVHIGRVIAQQSCCLSQPGVDKHEL